MEQLWGAVASVFGSWNNDRAIVYRRQYGYPHDWGTAANICSMVFGNMGDDCCTGVAFTRDPATGEKVFYGEYLINAQGEDVVAGIRTPKKIAELQKDMPGVYKQLDEIRNTLEKHYRDVQDIEFTVQKGKLWMLQTRNGKRTGFASVRFAVDMVREGLITREEALSAGRLPPDDLNQLLQPLFDPDAKRKAIAEGKLLAKGINAGPGAATGRIKFHAEDAENWVHKHGKGTPDSKVILVRGETSPEDIRGMQVADGILTAFGAEGIGLCRTEHMFFEGNRIDAMREMILATSLEARKKALDKLFPFQRGDFEGIFKAMQGRPVTIRTLDPPLHEFLPHQPDQQKELSKKIGVPLDTIARRVQELHEANP